MKATSIYRSADSALKPDLKLNQVIPRFDQDESKAEKALLTIAREAKENGRKVRLPKPRRQSIPKNLERQYQREINKMLGLILETIKKSVIAELPKLVESNEKRLPKKDSREFRVDINVAKRLAKLFASVRGELKRKFPKKELEKKAAKIGKNISRFNKEQVGNVFQSVLGVSLLSRESFLEEELQLFAINNANLISDVTNEFVDQTQQIVFSGIRKGKRHEEIAKDILGRSKNEEGFVSKFKKAKTRAALIARDQVNKLNGQLTETRQIAAGVEKYKWRTARDNRVRDKHKKREGETFSWNSPPNGGHPGEEINCRCFAEPILDDLI